MADFINNLTCQHVNFRNSVNLITEKFYTKCNFLRIRRKYF